MHHIVLDGDETTLVLDVTPNAPPRVRHWGARLHHTTPEELVAVGRRQAMHGVADVPLEPSLAMEAGLGFGTPVGLDLNRDGRDWAPRLVVTHAEAADGRARITCADARAGVAITYGITLDPATDVLTIAATLTNIGEGRIDLCAMASATLPIPSSMTEIIGFTGRWAFEFQRQRLARFAGAYVRENRAGRTSHASFPAAILCTAATTETAGEAYGLHLAWSGNHRLRVDTVPDGRVFASAGALLLPGEVRLDPGASYDSPMIVAAWSGSGLTALSRKFHAHVRRDVLTSGQQSRARPVHFNTWEGVYFDHDVTRLKAIASRAAALGAERFVLDDGWFGARRHDRAGLGDWTVARDVYPDGLAPLVEHVRGLGMEMGVWFEPEMVNPDSDLYRAHPDWVLSVPGVDQVPFRHQLVLDIARAEVANYLFERIDAILSAHPISYIKWDMNRDLSHPGGVDGTPRAAAQVRALYALLDRLRARHPNVEIESCASGGARPDYGVLAHSDRVWTSDSNDALDRQAIQRGASFFLPLEVLGAHVGPGTCHVSGRRLAMAFRVGTALMGHMGVELDPMAEPEDDLTQLQAGIALYKRHRALLHHGAIQRLDTPAYLSAMGVVAADLDEALFTVTYMTSVAQVLPDPLCLAGLDPARRYRLRLVWPEGWTGWRPPAAFDMLDLTGAGAVLTGEVLMARGLQLPASFPETTLILHLQAAA